MDCTFIIIIRLNIVKEIITGLMLLKVSSHPSSDVIKSEVSIVTTFPLSVFETVPKQAN